MNKWLAIPDSTKEQIYIQISEKTGMAPFAVEKDWWVTQTLALIFEMEVGKHLVFKGGTSLSKAFKLIERFSEDVDLAIDRSFLGFGENLSNSKRTELRKKAGEYTTGPFLEELKVKFAEKGLDEVKFKVVPVIDSDQDPRIIEIYYPNVIPAPGYLEPRVQIEVGCRSLKEPFSMQTFGSLVDEYYPKQDFAFPLITIPCVNPERTFLEKIFLLHEEFRRPLEKIRVNRLSRHLYDVVKLSQSQYAEKAFENEELYTTIVEHRHKYTRVSGVDYNEHHPKTINPIPVPEKIAEWEADYKTMLEEMIYEEVPPSFQNIMEELEKLKEKINVLDWKIAFEFPVNNK